MKKFHVGIKGLITKDNRILILKKKSGEFWDIPGGRIDGNEDIVSTLKREIQEELPESKNIRIKRILCAHRLHKDILDDISLLLVYYEISVDLPDPIKLSEEHSDYKWIKNYDEIELDNGTQAAVKEIFNKL